MSSRARVAHVADGDPQNHPSPCSQGSILMQEVVVRLVWGQELCKKVGF